MESISERIERLRKERNLTQAQVASAVGVTRVAVSKWESGTSKNLKLENLQAMCGLFGVTAEELIGGNISRPDIQKSTDLHQARGTYSKGESPNLSHREKLLIEWFRSKTDAEQKSFLNLIGIAKQPDFAKSA